MMPRIMIFKATGNIGDQMQAVALSRLTGPALGYFRDQPHLNPPFDRLSISAGFLLGPHESIRASLCVFAGVFWAPNASFGQWLSRCPFPVGARDPASHINIINQGVKSELIGCSTLTLPKYDGPRSGQISVDCDGPGERVTHHVPKDLTFDQEWDLCLKLLEKYKKAALVHTTRIHVALPCVAMGTPVRYVGPMTGRASIADAVGLKKDKECLPSVNGWKQRYTWFLNKYGVKELFHGDPAKPTISIKEP